MNVHHPIFKEDKRAPRTTLTPCEQRLKELLCEGMSNSQCAAVLSITVEGVKHHLHNLYDKMGVDSRCELVAMVLGREIRDLKERLAELLRS